MNTTNGTIDKTSQTQMSIQLFIVTGYTTLFYVTSKGFNLPLILSTLMYMFILIDWSESLVKFDY